MLKFSLVLELEFWGVNWNYIPYMWEVILTYVPIKGGIVYPCVHGLLNCSEKTFSLPAYMLKLPNVVGSPLVDHRPYRGEGAFRYSFSVSLNVLAYSPMYFSPAYCTYTCILLLCNILFI